MFILICSVDNYIEILLIFPFLMFLYPFFCFSMIVISIRDFPSKSNQIRRKLNGNLTELNGKLHFLCNSDIFISDDFPWQLQVLFHLVALTFLHFYNKYVFNHVWLSPILFELTSDIEDYSRFNANCVEVFWYVIRTPACVFINISLLRASISIHRLDTSCI